MPSASRGAIAPFADATDFEFLTAFASHLRALHDSLLALREACERQPYNPRSGSDAAVAVGVRVEELKASGLRGRRLIDLSKELADVTPSDWGAPFSKELAQLDYRAISIEERLYPIRGRLERVQLMLDGIGGDAAGGTRGAAEIQPAQTATAGTQPAPEEPNGPYAKGCFRIGSENVTGISEKRWKLIACLWDNAKGSPFEQREACEVWTQVQGLRKRYKRETLKELARDTSRFLQGAIGETGLEIKVEFTSRGSDFLRLRIED